MKVWDLVNKLTQTEGVRLYNANNNMMQIARANGKSRPAYIKVSIGDDDAEKLLRPIQPQGAQAFIVIADIEEVNQILDAEKKAVEGADRPQKETTSYPQEDE
ncbi:hypothetical protein [Sporomusa aerivorans]|uniref:hypothetical protein n=1 Tax=Sporomusa aerivorans TaxID=204936 RepID=UPI00352ADE89